MVEKIPELRRLISKGKTKVALERLLTQFANEASLMGMRDEFLLMSSRFESLESRLLTGVIPYSDYELTENRLISATIKLLNKLETSLIAKSGEIEVRTPLIEKTEMEPHSIIDQGIKNENHTIKEKERPPSSDHEPFYLQGPRGADASGEPTTSGFLVYRGSKIAQEIAPSLAHTHRRLRDSLLEDETILRINDALIFTKDFTFSSPSSAATIVLGRSANGLQEWKLASGLSLKAVRGQ